MTPTNEIEVQWNENREKDNINPEHYTQGIRLRHLSMHFSTVQETRR